MIIASYYFIVQLGQYLKCACVSSKLAIAVERGAGLTCAYVHTADFSCVRIFRRKLMVHAIGLAYLFTIHFQLKSAVASTIMSVPVA